MKKNVLIIMMALVLAFAMTACGGGSDDGGSAAGSAEAAGSMTAEEGVLHMATNATFPPYEDVADDGNGYVGIDVEIAQAIADELGLELVVDDMDFSSILTAVQGGKADIAMAGMTVTDERKESVDFTVPYTTAVQVVIVPEDSPIKTIDDLANANMIGCQEGTTGYIYCSAPPEEDGYGEDHVTAYTSGPVAVQALVAGKVDAVVIDQEPAKQYVAANPGLKILETEFAVEDYAIGISKDNPELYEAVNDALQKLIDDGTVQGIIDKYINTEE